PRCTVPKAPGLPAAWLSQAQVVRFAIASINAAAITARFGAPRANASMTMTNVVTIARRIHQTIPARGSNNTPDTPPLVQASAKLPSVMPTTCKANQAAPEAATTTTQNITRCISDPDHRIGLGRADGGAALSMIQTNSNAPIVWIAAAR